MTRNEELRLAKRLGRWAIYYGELSKKLKGENNTAWRIYAIRGLKIFKISMDLEDGKANEDSLEKYRGEAVSEPPK
ncbi:MAG TPA: hypothetical protein P5548_04075 [Candidatus Moranbacteria bacterium]|nr:hypothetical protein [Candidatus Moranbacteria bacterium]